MDTLLDLISFPADLRKLTREQLAQVANELREFLLFSIARTGGHLASNLGVVELTLALHYVFDTPEDRIVWDVGHQSYPHKVITGRREQMSGLRKRGGISGFPRRDESPYDTFGTAHSSTSISAALGMAHAARLQKKQRHCIAVIGDGALSAGLAYEAMNNATLDPDMRLLVILNDNDMSISPSVGALKQHLANVLGGDSAALFGALGLAYSGPIDGHDLAALIPALLRLRDCRGVQLLHVVTRKGCGFPHAEADPVGYHAPARFCPRNGILPAAAGKLTYTQVFSEWLCDEAERDPRVVGITPAMREGSGLVAFQQRFPDRYFDVGIAEQHALTFAAGLAAEGMRPVVAIYSTFLQRGYDQLIHDVAIQQLPVTFAIDRAGVVGADGATHMGMFDIAYLRCIPHLVVMCPADENECRQMLHTALEHAGPAAVRYPRGSGPGVLPLRQMTALQLGKARVCRIGRRIAILAFGPMLAPALEAGVRLDATVVNMRFVKPLDVELLRRMAQTHELLVTLEEGCVAGGAGSACLESLSATGPGVKTLLLGFPDNFVEHGEPAELLAAYGLDAAGIESAIAGLGMTLGESTAAGRESYTDESDSVLSENTCIYRGERS
ncbi:1-deoxy-D-xylulose-5-phosphate synthase [Serratia entomophila]|uniref:1-deoxy-D-xylulose-5-phosphate synthase n=1 Tax=Serratia entomophila TaxID=42906 RepID=UPI0021799005|nr:1-deoxy-D-xylulose-5-phosphate synthase [Serratia entomophila]CAI0759604.1 1-deoxy-D-xylulose-5-phosphate synthase [Serratia entomophila]CAI0822135.1 1-deoxy-D-xylulose-5-phosphate synthase [Serratia entomophila]CAI1572095.1 1-deoxy-D-xylulose-5-phosphate synthase [Serratia entomophila]CAI1588489.1 1-deoxy-D-xylulose-5-phosphate synthase [Serratia entomophila]CAI1649688.1 1-deoxy-D-xylulose-5-phosphate synthase [Serratia entomophila]